jgi:hypothetical protein
VDEGGSSSQPEAATAVSDYGIHVTNRYSITLSKTLDRVIGNVAKRRVGGAYPYPQRAVRIFADALKPVNPFQFEVRSDNPFLKVNEFLRYYPETTCAVGKDLP